MELWLILALPVLIFVSWLSTVTTVRTRFPTLRNKAILLLIAHPDDEAMFFAPTVLALTRPELGNHLKILCLSTGNADGLGKIRIQEIRESAIELGLRSRDDVAVLDDPEFPDSMTKEWSAASICELLNAHFLRTNSKAPKSRKDAAAARTESNHPTTIDVLITFDRTGVSSHPNHRSLYHGAVAWVQDLSKGRSVSQSPVNLYTLTSINVIRKYVGLLDVPGTLAMSVLRSISSRRREYPDHPVFFSDLRDYLAARRAMTQAHRSQMLWFRWGWITLGRYMYINDLQRYRV